MSTVKQRKLYTELHPEMYPELYTKVIADIHREVHRELASTCDITLAASTVTSPTAVVVTSAPTPVPIITYHIRQVEL